MRSTSPGQPATDNTYVYGYRVFQDGKQIARLGGDASTFTATGVAPGQHTFAVEAFDSASAHGAGTTDIARLTSGQGTTYGNTSAKGSAPAVTMPDVQAPTVPQNLQVTNPTNVDPTTGAVTGTRNARLVFDPSTDDSGAAPAYEVYRDGVLVAGATPTLNANGKMAYTDQRLTTGWTYTYAVLAKDAAGNRSAKTPEVSVTIAPDTTAPTFTGAPTATVPDIHGKDIVVSWQAATDDTAVTGYGIYRDGTRIAQVSGTTLSFRDVGLAPGTYKYKVDAVDSAGNRSDRAAQPNQLAAIANDPPAAGHNVTAYPARDFVSGDGYLTTDPATGAKTGQTVVVEVFRADAKGTFKVVGQARTKADNATGLVEVNHAGPGCWGTADFANTPDIRPGDVVRITPVDTDVPDQTTVSNVYVGTPIQTAADTVVIKGTAADAAGKPIAIGELEARIISNGAEFRLNGRRQLLAPGDGHDRLRRGRLHRLDRDLQGPHRCGRHPRPRRRAGHQLARPGSARQQRADDRRERPGHRRRPCRRHDLHGPARPDRPAGVSSARPPARRSATRARPRRAPAPPSRSCSATPAAARCR